MTEPSCDTLCLPVADTVARNETPPPFYKDMGFFQGDSVLHPEVKPVSTGFEGELRPYRLLHDDWVTLFVLLCFVMMVFIQKRIRSYVVSQAREFFLPSKNVSKKAKPNTGAEQLIPWFMMFLLSIMGALAVYMYTQSQQHLFLGQTSPYLLIGIYMVIWILYFMFKILIAGFLNWIFFDKKKNRLWKKSGFFLFSVEALLFFPLIIITIYLNLPPYIPLWIAFLLGSVIKILHLYKTFLIFFPNFYGLLHLIVYFCTLEIVPLMAVFITLIRVTELMTVKL